MKIAITQKLRPFSHEMGTVCLIPFSAWKVKAYPTKLFLEHMVDGCGFQVDILLEGPVKDFTVQQDLLEGSVRLFGLSKLGYFRYCLKQQQGGLVLIVEKSPLGELQIGHSGCLQRLLASQTMVLHDKEEKHFTISLEKLCLGNHKAQNFSSIRSRVDMTELFPLWLRLGFTVPQTKVSSTTSSLASLLHNCKERIQKRNKEEIVEAFEHLFLAGFSGMLVPRTSDEDYQGIVTSDVCPFFQPLSLLSEGACLIRSLFFQEDEGGISLLPCLPVEFSSGRLLGIKTQQGHLISLEWSKKYLRRLIIQVGDAKQIHLQLQKSLQRFRLRKNLKDKGVVLTRSQPIFCEPSDTLYLDCFEK